MLSSETPLKEKHDGHKRKKYVNYFFCRVWKQKSQFIENMHAYSKYEKIYLNKDEGCLWKVTVSHI